VKVIPHHLRPGLLPTLLKTNGLSFAVSVFIWFSLNIVARVIFSSSKYRRLSSKSDYSPEKPALWLVSGIHGLVSSVSALYLLFTSLVSVEKVWAYDDNTSILLSLSAGYFFYDFVFLLLSFRKGDEQFLIHHVFTFVLYAYAVFRPFAHYYGIVFLTWECSTLMLQLRKLMIMFGMQNSIYRHYNDIAFAVVFFLCRILWGFFASIDVLGMFLFDYNHEVSMIHPIARYLIIVSLCALDTLNLFWFMKILVGSRQTSKPRNKEI